MADHYYIRVRGRVGGPFDLAKLRGMIQRGQLTRTHEVSTDGSAWLAALELSELFPKKPVPQRTNVAEALTLSETAPPQRESTPPQATESSQDWHYSIDGAKRGPISWRELSRLADSGELTRSALVWTDGMPDWVEASKIAGLYPRDADNDDDKLQVSWSQLLPALRFLSDGSWGLPWVLCLATAVLFPLVLLEYRRGTDPGLFWVAMALSLYFSIIWTAFFHWCIDPHEVRGLRLVSAWLLTGTIGIVGVLVASLVLVPMFGDPTNPGAEASLLKRVVGMWVTVALVEELAKVFPVILLTRYVSQAAAPRTCMYFGVVCGLAFGTIEAMAYTNDYIEKHTAQAIGSGELVEILMLRWICLPLLHALWAGIAGFFVGLSALAPGGRLTWIVLGVAIASTLHALYDIGAVNAGASWLTIVAPAVSIALFVGYLRSEGPLSRRIAAGRAGQVAVS